MLWGAGLPTHCFVIVILTATFTVNVHPNYLCSENGLPTHRSVTATVSVTAIVIVTVHTNYLCYSKQNLPTAP